MERLDPEMKKLVNELKNAPDNASRADLEGLIKARVEVLSPIYHQVAVQFADLHDTPSRMMAKGVIREVIPWRESRRKLYWRLVRRLHEKKLTRQIEKTGANLNQGQKTELLRRWFTENERSKEATADKHGWEEDKPVAEWLAKQVKADHDACQFIKDNLKLMRVESMMSQFRKLVTQMNHDELHEAGVYLAQRLSTGKKDEFVEAVRQVKSLMDNEPAASSSGTTADSESNEKRNSKDDKQKDDSSASENGENF